MRKTEDNAEAVAPPRRREGGLLLPSHCQLYLLLPVPSLSLPTVFVTSCQKDGKLDGLNRANEETPYTKFVVIIVVVVVFVVVVVVIVIIISVDFVVVVAVKRMLSHLHLSNVCDFSTLSFVWNIVSVSMKFALPSVVRDRTRSP